MKGITKKIQRNKCIVDMNGLISFNAFLTRYPEQVLSNAKRVRKIILKNLPEIQEEIDFPAKMIAYSYGPKYADMICTIIPSQKGLKLGFYKGVDLPDPENILKGNGKLSRYVEIKTRGDINTKALATLLNETYVAYKSRRIL